MATESFGKTVYMDNDFADRFLAQLERVNKNPPPLRENKIKWLTQAEEEELTKEIKEAYGK